MSSHMEKNVNTDTNTNTTTTPEVTQTPNMDKVQEVLSEVQVYVKSLTAKAQEKATEIQGTETYQNAKAKALQVKSDVAQSEKFIQLSEKCSEYKKKVEEHEKFQVAKEKTGELYVKSKEWSMTCKKRSGESYQKHYIESGLGDKVSEYGKKTGEVAVLAAEKGIEYAKIGYAEGKKQLKERSSMYAEYSAKQLEECETKVERETSSDEKKATGNKAAKRAARLDAVKKDDGLNLEAVKVVVNNGMAKARVSFLQCSNKVASFLAENIDKEAVEGEETMTQKAMVKVQEVAAVAKVYAEVGMKKGMELAGKLQEEYAKYVGKKAEGEDTTEEKNAEEKKEE